MKRIFLILSLFISLYSIMGFAAKEAKEVFCPSHVTCSIMSDTKKIMCYPAPFDDRPSIAWEVPGERPLYGEFKFHDATWYEGRGSCGYGTGNEARAIPKSGVVVKPNWQNPGSTCVSNDRLKCPFIVE